MSLDVDVKLKYASFKSGIDAVKKELEGVGASAKSLDSNIGVAFKNMGSFATGFASSVAAVGFSSLIHDTLAWGDSLSETSAKLGISSEQLQRIQSVGTTFNTNVEGMTSAFSTFNNTLGLANAGFSKSQKAINLLGDEFNNLKASGASTDQLFIQAIESVAQYNDVAERGAVASKLFGDSGADIVTGYLQAGLTVQQVAEKMKGFNVVTDESVKKAGELNDKLEEFQKGAMVRFREGLLEDITLFEKWANRLSNLFGGDNVSTQIDDLTRKINDLNAPTDDKNTRVQRDAEKAFLQQKLDKLLQIKAVEDNPGKRVVSTTNYKPIGAISANEKESSDKFTSVIDKLLVGIRHVESSDGRNAPDRSGFTGAKRAEFGTASGEYQINNPTYKDIVKNHPALAGFNRMIPAQAKELAKALVLDHMQKYGGDEVKATLAYFVGQGTVDAAVKKYGESDYIDKIKVPGNNLTTRGYLNQVNVGIKKADDNSSLSGISSQYKDAEQARKKLFEDSEKEREQELSRTQTRLDNFTKTYNSALDDATNATLSSSQLQLTTAIQSGLESAGLAGSALSDIEKQEKNILTELITKRVEYSQELETQLEVSSKLRSVNEIAEGLVTSDKLSEGLAIIQDLLIHGKTGAERAIEAQKRLGTEFNKTENYANKAADSMSVFAEQAGRNMESNLAQYLFDPFKTGIDGMLSGFVDMLRKMVAEAAAAQIMDSLVGNSKSGSKGLLSEGFSALANSDTTKNVISGVGDFFSGFSFFADGGVVHKPTQAIIGEAGSEAVIPLKNGNVPVMIQGNPKNSGESSVYNISISMTGKGDPEKDGQKAAEAFMRSVAQQEITKATRPGNSLNRTTRF
jgi:hypothetical protein